MLTVIYDNMFQRALKPVLKAAAQRMSVVIVLGPRQSGKTTLTRAAFPYHAYVSLKGNTGDRG